MKQGINKIKNIVTLMLLVPTIFAFGQGYQVYLQGQVQQGMGGAGIALVQDATALFYNPGGSAFVPGCAVQFGGSGVIANTRFLDANTNIAYKTKSPVGIPFTAYAQLEMKEGSKIKFGYAFYTPFGSTIKWKEDWAGRFSLTQAKLTAVFFQPTVSYKITDKLGIGAGFVYAFGSFNLQKDIPLTDTSGNVGHADLNGKANGIGYNAGIYFKASNKLSIGFTYRSQVNMKVRHGDALFKVPSTLQSDFPTGKFKTILPLPQLANLGVAYKITDKLILALDINYAVWRVYDSLKMDFEKNTPLLTDIHSARLYENTFSFRLGSQYTVTDKLLVRAGIAYAMTPVPDSYVSPETPDANRYSYTAGAGYYFSKNAGVNISLQYIHYKRNKNTNAETNLTGTYKTIAFIPGVSVFYNF